LRDVVSASVPTVRGASTAADELIATTRLHKCPRFQVVAALPAA
jgi:hypothetical protein